MGTGPVGKGSILPLLAAGVGVAMTAVYLLIMRSQGNSSPAWWFVALLLITAGLSAYGGVGPRVHRMPSLTLSAFLFFGLGLVSILTVGLPMLLAAVLAGTGAALASRDTT